MATRVPVAGGRGALAELRPANGQVEVIGQVRSLDEAEEAMSTLRPSVIVLDAGLAHTIETHRARIQRRLGFGSRTELVRWVPERGLLAP